MTKAEEDELKSHLPVDGSGAFEDRDEMLRTLRDFLSAEVADVAFDASALASFIHGGRDPEFANRMVGMFEGVEHDNVNDGKLLQAVREGALLVINSDAEAQEFVMGLYYTMLRELAKLS